MMIIDCHTHVLPPRLREERQSYVLKDSTFAEIYSAPKARMATAEDLIATMEREGVGCAIIAGYGFSTHELCVVTNDYILESIARYPQRFFGFCAVPSCDDDRSLAEIERCARGGVRGVGELRPDLQLAEATEERLAPFLELLRRYHLILLLHCSEPVGHRYAGKGLATPQGLYPLLNLLKGIPVICAHWGGGLPFYALMPEVRQALEDVYFDTAASPLLYRPEVYRHVRDLVGADRILFGSDYPVVAPSRLLGEIMAADLEEADRRLMLSGNARRLLGI